MGVRGLGPEVRNHQRLLQRDRRRHNLAINGLARVVLDRTTVQFADLAQDRVLALRDIDLSALAALELADLGREREALVQQVDDAPVEAIDLGADCGEVH